MEFAIFMIVGLLLYFGWTKLRGGGLTDDQRAAQAWFDDLGRADDWCIVDFETTGIGDAAEILEVAIVNSRGEVLVDTTVLPKGRIPKAASDIHGLTRDALKGSPRWPDVYPKVKKALKAHAVVLAYNAKFDKRILKQTCQKHDLTVPRAKWECVMLSYAKLRDLDSWAKLGVAAEEERVPAANAHRALGDCQTTLGLINAVAEERQP